MPFGLLRLQGKPAKYTSYEHPQVVTNLSDALMTETERR